MSWIGTSVFPIFKYNDPTIPVGTVGYMQIGVYGTAKGLLLALTNTPSYRQVIQTDHGFKEIK